MSKKAKIISIILGIFIFLTFLFELIFYLIQTPPNKNETTKKDFEIKPNTPSLKIAESLKKENLIRSKWLFLAYLKFKKGTIKTGVYELSQSLNLKQITEILISGTVKEWIVTFPEGFSQKDMAEKLEKANIVKSEDFLNETSKIKNYQKDFSFLKETKSNNLEGFLFPDTYRFSQKTDSEKIVSKLLSNFGKKIEPFLPEIKKQNRNLFDIITLASIIEREAQKEEDRAKIASVYYNRLEKDMKLEADPTIQYAKGNWEKIKKEDYENIDSPYNTYKYKGLPPSPICNPGLPSIKASINPEKTDYLYFFHTKDGQTLFSKTKEEHEEKKKEYLK